MNSPVIIKGNKWGIKLIIKQEATIESVVTELQYKLQRTRQYYKNIKPIIVTFDGKELTEDEAEYILDTLRQIGLNIQEQNIKQYTITENKSFTKENFEGLFFIGNLRAGHSIDAKESIVIIGDVDQGATVYSEGNIIIIGELNGYAESGCKGRKDTFVYSLISGGN
ncbi:MAG: hypothetical protein IJX12_08215 [Lachnospiraceae bacterium]|nr:hypothetical protein [Lachnospiraceae bacterium]